MRPIIVPLLLLAACSAEPAANTTDVADVAPAGAAIPTAAATPAAEPSNAADSGANPTLGELKTFKDWTVGCDNTRTCKAVALIPGETFEDRLLAGVERAGDGSVTVRITGAAAADTRGKLAIDGRPVLEGGTARDGDILFTGDPARRAAEALAQGRAATLATGGPATPLSLAGAAAALRWMDAQQGFAGTAAALVAKGERPLTVAPPPAPPVVRAIAGYGATRPLAAAEGAALRDRADCGIDDYRDDPPAGEIADLGGGAFLILVPCDSGAYNLMSATFVRRGERTEPAVFDAETGLSPDPTPIPQPVNAQWQNGLLSTFAKGRGIGDCGSMQRFAWDGTRFRLVEQTTMSECRGSTDYITVWRARVVR